MIRVMSHVSHDATGTQLCRHSIMCYTALQFTMVLSCKRTSCKELGEVWLAW